MEDKITVCLDNSVKSNKYAKSFKCPELNCGKSFSWEESLKYHQRTHKPESYKFSCDECSKTFMFKSKFEIHKESHNPSRTCTLCGITVATKRSYDHHMQRCLNDFKFKCPICNKGFSTEQKLVSHLRVHTKEKPFECDKCDKKFPALSTLKSHQRRHEGLKTYSCDQCSWTGYDHSDRYHHVKRNHR